MQVAEVIGRLLPHFCSAVTVCSAWPPLHSGTTKELLGTTKALNRSGWCCPALKSGFWWLCRGGCSSTRQCWTVSWDDDIGSVSMWVSTSTMSRLESFCRFAGQGDSQSCDTPPPYVVGRLQSSSVLNLVTPLHRERSWFPSDWLLKPGGRKSLLKLRLLWQIDFWPLNLLHSKNGEYQH